MYKPERTTKGKEYHEDNLGSMGRLIPRKKKNSSKSCRQRQRLGKRRKGRKNQNKKMQKNTEWNTEMKITLITVAGEQR